MNAEAQRLVAPDAVTGQCLEIGGSIYRAKTAAVYGAPGTVSVYPLSARDMLEADLKSEKPLIRLQVEYTATYLGLEETKILKQFIDSAIIAAEASQNRHQAINA